MPYRYLAETFCELDQLVDLVHALEIIDRPLPKLRDESFLTTEVNRIKICASRDILIFGANADEYLREQVIKVDELIIRLLEILFQLPELSLMIEAERYQYHHCTRIKEELHGLSVFFESLSPVIKG